MTLFNDAIELKKIINDKAYKMPNNPPVFIQKFEPQKFMQILHDIGSYK